MKKHDTKKRFHMAAGVAALLLAAGAAVFMVWHFGIKDPEPEEPGTEEEVLAELPESLEETEDDPLEDVPEKDRKIGVIEREEVQDTSVPFEESGSISLKEVDMISTAGLAGSPECDACAEYEAYTCYTQEMADKVDEICEKYGLIKKTGFEQSENYSGLCESTGVGDFLGAASEEAAMEYEESYYYADGSFEVSANAIAAGSMSDCQIGRCAKGTFDATVLNVGNIEEYRQWTYKTKCGVTVFLANNGTSKALILADLEKSFIAVNVMGNIRTNTFDVSDETLEKMADSIDFSVIP